LDCEENPLPRVVYFDALEAGGSRSLPLPEGYIDLNSFWGAQPEREAGVLPGLRACGFKRQDVEN